MLKKQRNGLQLWINVAFAVVSLVVAWRMLPHQKAADKLRQAIYHQDVTTVKEIVAGGINLNNDSQSEALLCYAVQSKPDAERAAEMTDLLLNAGARCKDDSEVHRTFVSGNDKAVIMLIDRECRSVTPELLVNASSACSVPIMQHIIDKTGADVNGLYHSETPLVWVAFAPPPAQEAAQLTATSYLLARGANPNKGCRYEAKSQEKELPACNGRTPLMVAAQRDRGALMKLLLLHGAHVNTRTQSGQTALLIAVSEQSRNSVEALISAGADVNCKDNAGQTPLSLAHLRDNQRKQHSGIAELLVKAGAKI